MRFREGGTSALLVLGTHIYSSGEPPPPLPLAARTSAARRRVGFVYFISPLRGGSVAPPAVICKRYACIRGGPEGPPSSQPLGRKTAAVCMEEGWFSGCCPGLRPRIRTLAPYNHDSAVALLSIEEACGDREPGDSALGYAPE